MQFKVGDIITGRKNNKWKDIFSSHAKLRIEEIHEDRIRLQILDIDLAGYHNEIGHFCSYPVIGNNFERDFELVNEIVERIMVKW